MGRHYRCDLHRVAQEESDDSHDGDGRHKPSTPRTLGRHECGDRQLLHHIPAGARGAERSTEAAARCVRMLGLKRIEAEALDTRPGCRARRSGHVAGAECGMESLPARACAANVLDRPRATHS
jgi:hypothetical protein